MDGLKTTGSARDPMEQITQNKHLDISQAINELGSITKMLDDLLIRVRGDIPCNPEGNIPANPEPTLAEVLAGGSARIRNETKEAHQRIDELNSLLF